MLSTERYLEVYLDEAVDMFQFIRSANADLTAMGRALRRLALGMLLDREAPFDELRDQFRALIEGYLVRSHTATIALTA